MEKALWPRMSRPNGHMEKIMRRRTVFPLLVAVSCGLAVAIFAVAPLGSYVASAKQLAPTENKGFKTTKTQLVDLGPEIQGMNGRQLRLRVLTIEPSGHIKIHSHKDRPAVVYFIQGADTVTFGDGTEKTFRAGDTTSSTKNTTHWHRNDGNEMVILIAADILHKKK